MYDYNITKAETECTRKNFPSVNQSFWRRHSHSSHFNVLTALLPLILSFFDFHDTFSWFSMSSQSPLKVLPYLVIITYQNSWKFVLGDLLTLLFSVKENKEKTKRRPKKKGHRSRKRTLYQKMGGKAELRLAKASHMINKPRRWIMTGRNINQHVAVRERQTLRVSCVLGSLPDNA